MPVLSLIRVVSISSVALIAMQLPDETTFKSVVFSVGFGHYFMALLYSKRQISQVLGQTYSYLPLAAVLIAGTALYQYEYPLVIYFAVHHAFNEVYVLDHPIAGKNSSELKGFRASGIFLHLFVYFLILRDRPDLQFLDTRFLLIGLAVSSLSFIYFLNSIRGSMKISEMIDHCSFELIGLFLATVSFFIEITFMQIIFYHFMFWILYPMPRVLKRGRSELLRYFILTLVITVPFIMVSPLGIYSYDLYTSPFFAHFMMWSYLHITISFALSEAHPSWITYWFKPRRAIPSAALKPM